MVVELKDVYSGLSHSFVITQDLGDNVEIQILTEDGDKRIVSKKVLSQYEKGSINAIGKLLNHYSKKGFTTLITDLSNTVSLSNISVEKFKALEAKCFKIKDGVKRLERYKEIRRKHIRVVITSEGEDTLIENTRIKSTEAINDLIDSLGLFLRNGEVSPDFLANIFYQAKYIKQALDKIYE